jgi:Flp pilus assembly protein TadD
MVQEVVPEPKVEPVQEIVAQVEIVQESVPTPEVPVEVVQETVPAEEGMEVPVLKRKAEWPFEVSLRPLPNDREDRARLEANLLIAGKEREKALQVAEIGLKEGSDLELVLLKARALLSLGRGEEAAEALKNALRHAPDDVHIVMDMEALFHRYGGEGSRLLKGISACREARTRVALDLLERQEYAEIARMEVKDEGTAVKHAKALAQMRLGRYRDASKLLKMVLSEFPAYAEGLNNMGVCMRFMGEFDYDQAIHTMELALEVDSHYSDAMNNIGCTLFAAGRYDQALKVLHAVVDEDRRPEYLLNLSYVQMVLGDVAGAKDSLTTALKMDEGADVLYMLGVIAESEKQYRWALSLFTDALEKSPGFREAQAGKDRTRLLAKK